MYNLANKLLEKNNKHVTDDYDGSTHTKNKKNTY